MKLTGQVIDDESGEGVPGATVELWTGNLRLAATAASASGMFAIESTGNPDTLKVTSASYQPTQFAYNEISGDSYFPIARNEKELEGAFVTSGGKNKFPWLLAILVLAAMVSKK